jgi:hypothetical protein
MSWGCWGAKDSRLGGLFSKRRLVRRRQAEHSAGHRWRGVHLRFQRAEPDGEVRDSASSPVRSTSPMIETRRGPTNSRRRQVTRATPGSASSARSAAARIRGASSPIRNSRFRSMRTVATAASRTPTRMDSMASGVAEPVSWWAPSPTAAIARPMSAAESSANTARSVGSLVAMTAPMRSRSINFAVGLAWRTDRRNKIPSSANETASTT